MASAEDSKHVNAVRLLKPVFCRKDSAMIAENRRRCRDGRQRPTPTWTGLEQSHGGLARRSQSRRIVWFSTTQSRNLAGVRRAELGPCSPCAVQLRFRTTSSARRMIWEA